MKRQVCLCAATQHVTQNRADQYGQPENNFGVIRDLLNSYLGQRLVKPLDLADVAAIMCCFKLGRISTGVVSADNWIDLAGYAACGCELQTES